MTQPYLLRRTLFLYRNRSSEGSVHIPTCLSFVPSLRSRQKESRKSADSNRDGHGERVSKREGERDRERRRDRETERRRERHTEREIKERERERETHRIQCTNPSNHIFHLIPSGNNPPSKPSFLSSSIPFQSFSFSSNDHFSLSFPLPPILSPSLRPSFPRSLTGLTVD